MPLLNIHLVNGRSADERALILQVIHETMVEAFEVPVRDRYQIVHEHDADSFIMEDTGFAFERTKRRVLIHMTTRPRSHTMKQRFYALVVDGLRTRCGIDPEDVMIFCVENSDADWSFGQGNAQFLTGEL